MDWTRPESEEPIYCLQARRAGEEFAVLHDTRKPKKHGDDSSTKPVLSVEMIGVIAHGRPAMPNRP